MRKIIVIISVLAVLVIGLWFVLKSNGVNPPLKALSSIDVTGGLPLDSLKLPDGFKIEVYADSIPEARSIYLSSSGTLYVGNRDKGNVYALRDEDKDGFAEKKYLIYSNGNMPNGVTVHEGSLYIAEVNRILRIDQIEANLSNPPKPTIVYDKYPTEKHHGWKYIAFGPDGRLYVPVGAPCNICESKDSIFNTITSITKEGKDLRIEARGVRNSVGFTWHPDTKQLWFTDNGRDMMGDDVPNCEVNRVSKRGEHFGYPYCHEGSILDPEFGKNKKCNDYTSPIVKVGPHTAPLGIVYYRHDGAFPDSHNNKFFIAKHGSWNRSQKIGYEIDMVDVDSIGHLKAHTTFIKGWLNTSKKDQWGRPVDLKVMPDGSLLISDDYANCIYKVSYSGK